MPLNFSTGRKALQYASVFPARKAQSWILGVFDKDSQGHTYNSVCAITNQGTILPSVYHKRYLVPVGEFTPDWIRETPIGTVLYGFNKQYNDTSSGDKPVVFDLGKIKVAPLVCFENAFPRLCTESIRTGGELLVDSSDNSWFYRSILSDQMISLGVMRAVENHRSFVFATALGPSAIVDSSGHILRQAPREKTAAISCEVPIEKDITPYTSWCF
jgi:apolipoprotein N-acyltransferase